MCLIALALDAHPRHGFVVAANRDEYFDRASAPLHWWPPAPGAEPLLAGRDLDAGGTWMGLARNGRFGALTNVRDPARHHADAPSRGALVPAWLASDEPHAALWPKLAARGCNPFNLVGGELHRGRWWWADDRSAAPRVLAPGVYGLSNAALDTPWPKVQRLKAAMQGALEEANDDAGALTASLFAALSSREAAADADLPDTGVGLARERALAPAFIRMPDARYGTRCSTVIVGARERSGWRLVVTERSFDAAGALTDERREDWTLPALS